MVRLKKSCQTLRSRGQRGGIPSVYQDVHKLPQALQALCRRCGYHQMTTQNSPVAPQEMKA
eukprot:2469700-Karenia_brevis.AAC.1